MQLSVSPITILYVEDDPNNRGVFCELLTHWGYSVTAVESAKAAMACLAKGHGFTVLVTDINLPDASGIELAMQAHALTPTMRIIFTTGVGYLLTPPLPFAFSLVAKPFDFVRLRDVIQVSEARPATNQQLPQQSSGIAV